MIGYLHYTVSLFLVTGILILFFDVKGYKLEKMKKEEKTSRYIGWINISLGIITYSANWAYQKWFW